MTKYRLKGSNVATVHNEMASEGMPKNVGKLARRNRKATTIEYNR